MKNYCPFQSIQTLLAAAAGVHALGEKPGPDSAVLQKAYGALEEAGQAWVFDLAARVRGKGDTLDKKDLYRETAAKIAQARDLIASLDKARFGATDIDAVLEELHGLAHYYAEHTDAIMAQQRTNPDVKAKLYAHFGDMLVA